uniref:DUF6534 domain-containing protein n=1 Tax=Moniliophthora roreri TaxID=221103 RepID=A0A0W0ET93_MONRR
MAAPLFDMGYTFGAFLLAVIVSSCLYGVMCLQTWYYFRNYNDRLLLRGIVLAILALETIHITLAIHAIYHYLILNFGNPFALVEEVWSAIVGHHTRDCLDNYYCTLILCRKNLPAHQRDWWTPTIVCILKAIEFALTITVTINAARVRFYIAIAENERVMTMAIAGFASAVANDIVCAVALSYYLHTSRSGIKSTDTLINKLIAYAIHNGALTSLTSISIVVLIAPKPKNLVYFSMFEVIGNLYANSLLSTLNSRKSHANSRVSLPVTVDSSNQSLGTLRTRHGSMSTTHVPETRNMDLSKLLIEPLPKMRLDGQDVELLEMKIRSGRR